jgi:hypothetical protein
MAALVFIYVCFFHSIIGESEDGADSVWDFHWIAVHRRIALDEKSSVYRLEGFRCGVLLAEIFVSVCLTWILSILLARFRNRKGRNVA